MRRLLEAPEPIKHIIPNLGVTGSNPVRITNDSNFSINVDGIKLSESKPREERRITYVEKSRQLEQLIRLKAPFSLLAGQIVVARQSTSSCSNIRVNRRSLPVFCHAPTNLYVDCISHLIRPSNI